MESLLLTAALSRCVLARHLITGQGGTQVLCLPVGSTNYGYVLCLVVVGATMFQCRCRSRRLNFPNLAAGANVSASAEYILFYHDTLIRSHFMSWQELGDCHSHQE